jgi:hypothetical protein
MSTVVCSFGKRVLASGSLLLVALISFAAEQVPVPSETPPVTRAYRLSVVPKMDGQIVDDPAWGEVQPASGFWQVRPYAGRPATQRTNVYIGFSNDSLYVGVICFDEEPDGIIVADSRRDSSLEDTDSFQVILDSFHDKQNGFVFGTNAAGIEYDGQVIKESSDVYTSGGGGFNLNIVESSIY